MQGQVEKSIAVGQSPPKGPWTAASQPARAGIPGEAMSAFEITMIVFGAVTITIALTRLMIYLADKFSQRK